MLISTSKVSLLLLAFTSSLALATPHGPPAKASPQKGRPCGFKIAPCETGFYCRANDLSCPAKRGENCAGTCQPGRSPILYPTKAPHPTTTTTSPTPTPSDNSGDLGDLPAGKYKSCGGFRVAGPTTCDVGESCIDDPYALAKGSCGQACDRPGICVKPELCGGFANFKCKDPSKKCFDDPCDDCDPKNGGADCSGICV